MHTKADSRTTVLALAALGIVFGDIGTSPLYTLKACFDFSGASPANLGDVLGIASLLVYALVLVVCIKYVGVIMRADHEGEGGILALLALSTRNVKRGFPVAGGALLVTVVIGPAMLLGGGSLTPAISVISAIEGLELISPAAAPFVVPVSVAILIGLFLFQSHGTEKIGRIFGPVMLLWFIVIGVSGVRGILQHPGVLAALDPRHAAWFLTHHGLGGYFVLGGVVLAMTGVEALYADLSHFGRLPITYAWYGVVFPSLILCYLGECAMTLVDVQSLQQPFYSLAPGVWRIPAILLATVATVIASQALISGAFTLVQQAIALGISPRLEVRHTSAMLRGQVYVPVVNSLLMVGCVSLVLLFRSSSALASAFGLAVSCTMLATSFAWFHVAVQKLGMSQPLAVALLLLFSLIDGSFVIAGLPKFFEGGWVPFAVSAVFTVIALVWRYGREEIARALARAHVSIEQVNDDLEPDVADDAATIVVLSPDPDHVPFFGAYAWMRNLMNRQQLVLLTLIPEQIPFVLQSDKIHVSKLGRITRIEARFGYMQSPRLRPIIEACHAVGLDLDRPDVSYIVAEPRIRPASDEQSMLQTTRRTVFTILYRIGRPISEDMRIPSEQQIEVGVSVYL